MTKRKLAALSYHSDTEMVFIIPTLFAYYDRRDHSLDIGITFLTFTFLLTINKTK